MSSFQVAILTVSDTASVDAFADTSGPALVALFSRHQNFTVTSSAIVPDDISRVRATVLGWVARQGENKVDLIVSTGGTGFGPRDTTPEALGPLIERHAPGLVHLLLSFGLTKTPMAVLARPVAGTIGTTLIVTLPGSEKAVREGFEALVLGKSVVKHALALITGRGGENMHAARKGACGHGEPHARGAGTLTNGDVLSHDPAGPVSARHRKSPYPLLHLADALQLIFEHTPELGAAEFKVSAKLRGHVLAEDIFAPTDIPLAPTTNVDGYAVIASATPHGTYPLSTVSPLPPGHIARVNTGFPLPMDADAVVMVEDTLVKSTSSDGEELSIKVLAQVEKGENVRQAGSDLRQGQRTLTKGTILTDVGGEVGTLAFVGKRKVLAYRKPTIAILSTGNEVIDLHNTSAGPLQPGQVYDSNRLSLHAALESKGYDVMDLGVVPDSMDDLIAVLRKGLAQADVLLTTGGTSMGEADLLKPAIERHLGGTIHFGRVAMKPGKPTTFATTPGKQNEKDKLVFALPGNPASALVCLFVFVLPALRKMSGVTRDAWELPRLPATLATAFPLSDRPEFHRVHLEPTGGGFVAHSTGGQRSSLMASMAGANGFVCLPALGEGQKKGELGKGEKVEVLLVGGL